MRVEYVNIGRARRALETESREHRMTAVGQGFDEDEGEMRGGGAKGHRDRASSSMVERPE